MVMVTVMPVETKKDLKTFIEYPNKLYKGNPYFVPELISDEFSNLNPAKNPAYEHSEAKQWLAYKDGKVAGRVMALINNNVNARWNKKQARFSRLDFIEDPEVSTALVAQAEAWAKEKGMVEIVGPMGFCDFDKEAMLIEGFEEVSTFVTYYNHPYYKEHVERLGYEKEVDWMEFQLQVPDKVDPKIARIAQMVQQKTGFKLLEFKRSKEILPWGKAAFNLLCEAYNDLYGYVPLTEKQVDSYISQFFGFVNPAFIKGVVDKENNMIAIAITMPSLSKALQRCGGHLFPFGFIHLMRAIKKNDTLDMYLVAVKPEYQNLGLNAILMDAIYREAITRGYKFGESNPELETNEKVQATWKFFPRRQHRRRRVFIKHLV
jgi:ribosomal protein S18 acetylase RimI-like enzyme